MNPLRSSADGPPAGARPYAPLTITANGTTIATFSNLNHASGYQRHTFSLGGRTGSVTIKFTGTEDSSLQTSFVIDDTAVNTG